MDKLRLFVGQYWSSILIVTLFVIGLLILLRKNQTILVRQILFDLVCKAEITFGGGTGELKYASVVTELYLVLPTIIKILYSPRDIDRMIEEAVAKMKKYLEANECARTLIEESCLTVE